MSKRSSVADHAIASVELESGVLVFRYRDGVYVDERAAKDLIATVTELIAQHAPLPTLVVMNRVKGVSKDARDFFAKSEENRALSSRVALVVNSPIARIVANFFMGFNKPEHPTRLFNDEHAARAWLLQ